MHSGFTPTIEKRLKPKLPLHYLLFDISFNLGYFPTALNLRVDADWITSCFVPHLWGVLLNDWTKSNNTSFCRLSHSCIFHHFLTKLFFLHFRRRYLVNLSSLVPFKGGGFIVSSDVEVRSRRIGALRSATIAIVCRTKRKCLRWTSCHR